ncbi:MAG: GGDEF domain-containing protein [Methylovulum sp.]|nr:GGDEF domain-containing protein [Methylovulum sp.]
MDNLFFRDILDSLEEQLAIIDNQAFITFVNESWMKFYVENGGNPNYQWLGRNYLKVCEASHFNGDVLAIDAITGIKSVLQGDRPAFSFEYPCHSPNTQRWFILRMVPAKGRHGTAFVLTHQNITLRKLAEQAITKQSLHDPLTGLSNRRHFDIFMEEQWRRCKRDCTAICIMMLDLDNLKRYNDEYGHLAGDECLKNVADILQPYAARASDLCIRFGGDEFSLVLGNSTIEHGTAIAHKIINAVSHLGMHLPNRGQVGISIGLTCRIPEKSGGITLKDCIALADRALYKAKKNGRNRLEIL